MTSQSSNGGSTGLPVTYWRMDCAARFSACFAFNTEPSSWQFEHVDVDRVRLLERARRGEDARVVDAFQQRISDAPVGDPKEKVLIAPLTDALT